MRFACSVDAVVQLVANDVVGEGQPHICPHPATRVEIVGHIHRPKEGKLKPEWEPPLKKIILDLEVQCVCVGVFADESSTLSGVCVCVL